MTEENHKEGMDRLHYSLSPFMLKRPKAILGSGLSSKKIVSKTFSTLIMIVLCLFRGLR